MARFGGKKEKMAVTMSKMGSERRSEISHGDGLTSALGDNSYVIEKKIEQLGHGVPQMDNDLQKLQKEIHTMVSSFNEL